MNTSFSQEGYLLTAYGAIAEEACDYNGHLNEGHALVMLSKATDSVLDAIRLDATGREQLNFSAFTVQNTLYYLAEGQLGQEVEAWSRLLTFDEKRLRLFHQLRDIITGEVLVELETLLLGVDMNSRRAACWPAPVSAALEQLKVRQQRLPQSENVGRAICKPVI
ncbi:thioesterase family protein [Marinobacterium jannaschii]|uniref:thioesterase family protein n=1 Tax=Marinobacterium jannaschii TaxID=64970 RepID=UPI000686C1C8|nr:thioesterase family protein [Marinobacterium jannaschii]